MQQLEHCHLHEHAYDWDGLEQKQPACQPLSSVAAAVEGEVVVGSEVRDDAGLDSDECREVDGVQIRGDAGAEGASASSVPPAWASMGAMPPVRILSMAHWVMMSMAVQGRQLSGRGWRNRRAAFWWVSLRIASLSRCWSFASRVSWQWGQVESAWG